jgi:hypothetical protein
MWDWQNLMRYEPLVFAGWILVIVSLLYTGDCLCISARIFVGVCYGVHRT